jgi:putative transposase
LTNLFAKLALTSQETLENTISSLSTHISLETTRVNDLESLFKILVRAASCGATIEQTTKELNNVPSSNTLRYHLKKIKNFKQLEAEINLALKSQIPAGLNKKNQTLALDLNLIPYYGEPTEEERPYIYRSQAKDGTCTFYAYATLYLIKKGKRGKKGVEYFVYVVHQVATSFSHIRQSYRQRFGIESSYRLKNVGRIRTTTKNPVIRLLFVGISFLLVNIWVNLLWRRISQPRRGGRLIYRARFTLKQMLSFLRQAVDEIFGTVKDVYIPLNDILPLPSPAT